MFCEKCGKRIATTHIKTVVNGSVKERDLCEVCAAEEGYSEFHGGGLADMLISMLSGVSTDREEKSARRCPVCGSDFSDIAKTGKAGCSECYKTFYTELLPYLKRLHGSVNHVGKTPDAVSNETGEKTDELTQLRERLQTLVAEEKYEEAALVRDKIKELEGKDHE